MVIILYKFEFDDNLLVLTIVNTYENNYNKSFYILKIIIIVYILNWIFVNSYFMLQFLNYLTRFNLMTIIVYKKYLFEEYEKDETNHEY